jgi:tetratricopeptide (TPR) repeat protein
MGDEFVFIVNNPDVNPAADPGRRPALLLSRLGAICTKIHDDLYQPVPILTYAVEWELTDGKPGSFRRTDLLLHALNAVLLWWLLWSLLARGVWFRAAPVPVVAWALALLWALHPALVTAYASDMGRTHLLSATFALLAFGLHLRALTGGRWHHFAGSVAALLLAMLSKAIPGWILLVVVLEAACVGWRRMLASPRVYVIGLICVAMAGLTLYTSARSGLTEDASKGLFGDPLARSGVAVWIYFRDLVAPFWLTVWHLPDPKTGWAHLPVWAGLGLALASALHAARSRREASNRTIAVGWAWCWAMLLPVLGLIGAREAAAVDRYLYQPLMGILLVVGVVLIRWLASLTPVSPARSTRVLLPIVGVLGLAMLLSDLPQCAAARSVIGRAKRVVQLNPGDPRALEGLAAAYDFAQNHPLPPSDLEGIPPEVGQQSHFRQLWLETLRQTTSCENLAHYFPGPDDRGPFHRRLSYRFLRAGDPEQSLAQARQALDLLPKEFTTWKRLAHACQALGRLAEAADAYEHCERLLPDDPLTRAVHFTDYGYLLMFELERDGEACPRFAAALETGLAPPLARLGLALCEIRYGQGARGFQLVGEVLQADPGNVQAGLVLAEYHLRSHHWEQAAALYDAILRDNPIDYTALRGFHEVCLQVGRPNDAAAAWYDALRQEPGRREFESYLVWALALARAEDTSEAAGKLLGSDPDNPLACLAMVLETLRAEDLPGAIAWIERARAGKPIPKARPFERAATTLRLLLGRGELPPEAAIVEAAVYLRGDRHAGTRAEATRLLDQYLTDFPASGWAELAKGLRRELSDVESEP